MDHEPHRVDTTTSAATAAWKDLPDRIGRPATMIGLGSLGTFCAAVASGLPEEDIGIAGRALVSAGGFITAVLIAVIAIYAISISLTACRQRDEARNRLRALKLARSSYVVVPVLADTVPRHSHHHLFLRCEIRNHGRGAKFAVILDELEGLPASERLIDPGARLYWGDRPGIADEEIPPNEPRIILVATLDWDGSRWILTPMSADGPRDHGRTYDMAETSQLVVWLRISVRGVPELSYSKPIGIKLCFDQRDRASAPAVSLLSDGLRPEELHESPVMEGLLESITI